MHMKLATLAAVLATTFSANPVLAQSCSTKGTAPTYPVTKKVDQTDNYHGTVVADPYRWLEDANSAETKVWVDAQNKVTQAYLAQIPQRDAIRQRLTQAVELRALQRAVQGGRPLLLQPQRRPAEPGGAVHAEEPERRAAPAARPEHAVRRRHGRAGRHRSQPRRQTAGLRHRRVRFGLERDQACATSRPARTCRTTSSGSSSRAPRGRRTARASSTAATTSRRKRPSWPT